MLSALRFCAQRDARATISLLVALCLYAFAPSAASAQDPLEALLKKAQEGVAQTKEPGAGQSAVTFVWLSGEELTSADAEAMIDRAVLAIRAEAARFLEGHHITSLKPGLLIKRLNINHVPVNEALPLHIEGLAALTRDSAKRALILGARAATLISYRGDALRGHAQLSLTCLAALSALTPLNEQGVLVSLEAGVALTRAELKARCERRPDAELATTWARPDIEALAGGQLRLVSRGLAQLGRPELELGPLSEAEARALFAPFVAHLKAEPLEGGALSVSSSPCLRPTHAYEGRCVRLSRSKR